MAFLTYAELKTVAPADFLSILVGEDQSVVDEVIAEMTGLIKTNIGAYYDAENIFGQTAAGRDTTVLMYLKDLVYYKLLKRRSPGNALNEDEYNEAMKWLEDISTGKRRANLPPIKIDLDGDGNPETDTPFMKLRSNRKYQNGW